MTLTKKELMAAVKLCSDVAVQRGLPNMRIRPKSHVHYHYRAPFHSHPRKQPNINHSTGVSNVIPVKPDKTPTTVGIHAQTNSKGDYLTRSLLLNMFLKSSIPNGVYKFFLNSMKL